ncbi:hypothetical protein DSECCO2_562970 [anaerobic digester metagenome]
MAFTPIATIERTHASERPENRQSGPVNDESREKIPVSARMFARIIPAMTSRTAFTAEEITGMPDTPCTYLPFPAPPNASVQ